jgi:hypothetical protein
MLRRFFRQRDSKKCFKENRRSLFLQYATGFPCLILLPQRPLTNGCGDTPILTRPAATHRGPTLATMVEGQPPRGKSARGVIRWRWHGGPIHRPRRAQGEDRRACGACGRNPESWRGCRRLVRLPRRRADGSRGHMANARRRRGDFQVQEISEAEYARLLTKYLEAPFPTATPPETTRSDPVRDGAVSGTG